MPLHCKIKIFNHFIRLELFLISSILFYHICIKLSSLLRGNMVLCAGKQICGYKKRMALLPKTHFLLIFMMNYTNMNYARDQIMKTLVYNLRDSMLDYMRNLNKEKPY